MRTYNNKFTLTLSPPSSKIIKLSLFLVPVYADQKEKTATQSEHRGATVE